MEQARDHSFPLVEQPSLLQMVESGGCPPPMNITSQFPVNNILPQTSIVNSGSNYNSNCYSFAGQSGICLSMSVYMSAIFISRFVFNN